MDTEQSTNLKAMELIQKALGNTIAGGDLGVLLARAGVGKTACLTHIALEHLLRGFPVLHVCLNEVPDKIKVWYAEFLKNIAASQPEVDLQKLQHGIEPLRFILAYLHQTFTLEKLQQSLLNLKEQAKFKPSMVVLDGMNFDQVTRGTIEALKSFAVRNEVPIWMSALTHRHITTVNERGIPYPCHETDDLFAAILLLEPVTDAIQIKVLKHADNFQPEYPALFLNPQTYMLQLG
ncbi:DnaB helicase C-terminal domain-containing protein [Desulfoferrobacter suflitae]|uniref:DnaB helicase C-terminal domain-containing protein n=1 Tax=Desulfoferrobacter suflitae TaxID=2865782 RepID=UPI0021649C22|nr:DnaB helicase C-terminal domain-containing protein [Desulfoferrobacter suflitae]MCK8600289.1 DnaB helicase C-terminal domain-containing protein [Desulfoferrobacter suflitae]